MRRVLLFVLEYYYTCCCFLSSNVVGCCVVTRSLNSLHLFYTALLALFVLVCHTVRVGRRAQVVFGAETSERLKLRSADAA